MKVKFSPYINTLSGTENLLVYKNCKNCDYVSHYKKPKLQYSNFSENNKNIMRTFSNRYFALSKSVRDDFNIYANTKFNSFVNSDSPDSYSGQSAFNSLYSVCNFSNNFLAKSNLGFRCENKTFSYGGLQTNLIYPVDVPSDFVNNNLINYYYGANLYTDIITPVITITPTLSYNSTLFKISFINLTPRNIGAGILVQFGLGKFTNGLRLYISNVCKKEGGFFRDRFNKILFSSGYNLRFTNTSSTTNNNKLAIFCRVGLTPTFYISSGWYFCTLVILDEYGQQHIINSQWVQA